MSLNYIILGAEGAMNDVKSNDCTCNLKVNFITVSIKLLLKPCIVGVTNIAKAIWSKNHNESWAGNLINHIKLKLMFDSSPQIVFNSNYQ